jgi:hypothetical protein
LKRPVTVHPLTDSLYQTHVRHPAAKGHYPASFSGFLSRHPGATHGVFDAEGRLAYIGKQAELHAAHRKHGIIR